MTSKEALDNLVKASCPSRVCCDECSIKKSCNSFARDYIKTIEEDLEVLEIMSKYFGWLNFDNMEESEKAKIMNYYLKKGK